MAQHQPADWKIFCVVVKENISFSVNIRPDANVGDLKNAIKTKTQPSFHHFAADSLTLYLVNLPDDDDLAKHIDEQLAIKPPLTALKATNSNPRHPGIKRKASWEIDNSVAAKRLRVIEDPIFNFSPSILAQGVYNPLNSDKFVLNRPPLLETLPVAILNPIFGQFMEGADTHIPTAADNALVRELRVVMSKCHGTEREYCSEFRYIVTKHYPDVQFMSAETGDTTYTSDGDLNEGDFILPVGEGRTRTGRGDPTVQAVAYYIASLRHWFERGDYPDRLPCMVIYFVGPLLCFAGAVLTDRLQLETLTSPLAMHTNPYEDKVAGQAARTFGAFRHAVQRLREHYRALAASRHPASAPEEADMENLIFPYKSSFTNFEGKWVEFHYVKRLFPDKLLFIAEAGELNILIKFTRRYSEDAHRLCAEKEVAPKLYAVEHLAGGWMMVAMDYLDPREYINLYPPPRSNPALLEKIKEVVQILHSGGFVHGDVRGPNLMVSRTGAGINKVMLVDFDWAGLDGKVQYPAHINPETLPIGVSDGQPMEQKHDLEMLNYVFR